MEWLEQDLKKIKDAKLDIELFNRQNEKLCLENDIKIGKLRVKVEDMEIALEKMLTKSGEKKLECKLGWCSFRVQPDKWEYDLPKLIKWAKENDLRADTYLKVVTEFRKAQLKSDYEEGIITHDDVCDEGLTITTQDPKFNYKINGGL